MLDQKLVLSLDGLQHLRIIGGYAFGGCPKVTGLRDLPMLEEIGASALDSANIPEVANLPRLRRIGASGLSNRSLVTVGDLPSLEYIGDSAFRNATSLTTFGAAPNVT